MLPKEKLKKLYQNGLSMMEIAEKRRWSYYTVKYWMEKYNIPRRSRSESCYYGYWNRHNNVKLVPSYKAGKKIILEKVKSLYYKKGYSARQIGEFFGRSATSIYKFMRRYGLVRRSAAETNNIAYVRQDPSYHLKKYLTPKEEKLKIAGIMLYWAEGSKNLARQNRGATVDLANSDPLMIQLFLEFLRKICGIDKKRLRILLYCYANQDIKALKRYWHKVTKISLNQFIKSYVREDFLPDKIGKMKYGLVHIRYSDKKLFLQIKTWIKQYLNKNIDEKT